MESPQFHRGLFDLHCWHISNTTCHQSSFQPRELQLTFDPSPLLPLRKVGALNFGRLTAFLKRVFGGRGFWVTDIWDVKKRGWGAASLASGTGEMNGGWLCVKSLNCAPQHSPQSPFTAPQLKYLQTNQRHSLMFVHLLICW